MVGFFGIVLLTCWAFSGLFDWVVFDCWVPLLLPGISLGLLGHWVVGLLTVGLSGLFDCWVLLVLGARFASWVVGLLLGCWAVGRKVV